MVMQPYPQIVIMIIINVYDFLCMKYFLWNIHFLTMHIEKLGLGHLHRGHIFYKRLYRQNIKRHPRINTGQK